MTTRETSRAKSASFSRPVREIFVFLIVLVAASNLSGIFLLDRVVREEDRRIMSQLDAAIAQLHALWDQSPPEARVSLDLDVLAREWQIGKLSVWTLAADSIAGKQRWVVTGHSSAASVSGMSSSRLLAPPIVRTGWGDDGEYWQMATRTETWGKSPVVVNAGVAAPVLGSLRRQFRLEMWVRGFILTAFLLFAILFHRIVLGPFRDMRRRAADLVGSGLLPEVPGGSNDDPEYVMATFDELVHRLIKQAHEHEQRAASSERRARSVERFNEYMLTSMSTGVMILGGDGQILRANRSAERILGIGSADIIGQPYDRTHLYPEMIALIEEGLKYGQVYSRREMRIERPGADGPFYLGISTSRIRNEFDEVVGLSVLVTDLTEIRRLYDELAANQRLADLGEMAAGLAHQLRNSMAAILGYGRLLRNVIGAGRQETGWVDSVITETEETALMLQRFLDFARPLSGERLPVDVNDVIAEAIETTTVSARQANVQIVAGQPAATPSGHAVMGDALLLRQVVINLIQNAIEATPPGGQVTVASRIEEIPHGDTVVPALTRDVCAAGGSLACLIEIADNGSGVALADRTRIFHPFYTSKETGTGLGLPLAKKITVFHGGNLTLERSGPDGSVFLMTLPLTTERPAPDTTRENQRTPALTIR